MDRKANIKELNDEIAELRQLELDIAGLRAEIDKYSQLLDKVPNPGQRGTSPTPKSHKRRRTDSGVVPGTPATPAPPKRAKATKSSVKGTKAAKNTVKKSAAKRKKAVDEEEEDDHDAMDLNDDGRITRSESRAYASTHKKAPNESNKADSGMFGSVIIEEDLINSDGYTLLTNLSDSTMDLSGWKIKARIGRMQLKFPKNTSIKPQGNIYVWAKNAADPGKGKENVIWKSREQTKGDDHDILELYDDENKVVHRFSVA